MLVASGDSRVIMLDHLDREELVNLTSVEPPTKRPWIQYGYLIALLVFAFIIGPSVTLSHRYLPSALGEEALQMDEFPGLIAYSHLEMIGTCILT
jgi:hypothetical protein